MPKVGDRVGGRYELLRALGSGSYGAVFEARDADGVGRSLVAVKFLRLRDENLHDDEWDLIRARFEGERHALQGIGAHRHVVRVLGGGEHQGRPYLVMERIEGVSLAAWMEQRGPYRLTQEPSILQAIVDQVCLGLARIHDTEVSRIYLAHRDIKPENVMLHHVGDEEKRVEVKIIDLGSALVGEKVTRSFRARGYDFQLVRAQGTPAYEAPECAERSGDARSDVFSVAVMAYELAADHDGDPAYVPDGKGADPWSVATRGVDLATRTQWVKRYTKGLPDAVCAVLSAALAESPRERPGDAGELRRRLEEAWGTKASELVLQTTYVGRRGWHGEVMPEGLRRAEEPEHAGHQRYWHPLPGGDRYLMVYIPPGTFWRGSDDGFDWEKPRHRCTITKGFYLGVHPVTVGQYRRFVAASKHDAGTRWDAPGFPQTDEHPVVCVSWDDAVTFRQRAGLRLPTEAEWEYAARGAIDHPENTDYPKGRAYPWGNKVPTVADPMRETHVWWSSDGKLGSAGGTRPVGGREGGASVYGVHDMAGNVWEWCADRANDLSPAPYDTSQVVDPTGPSMGSYRVIRGGS